MNYRKLYESAYGPQPEKEIHHIIPQHQGGTDDIENLIALSKTDHQRAHMDLYIKFGNFRDLCAYHMIVYNFTEAHRISSSNGGRKGGEIMKSLEIGVCTKDLDLRNKWLNENNHHYVKNGLNQRDNKKGIHGLSREQMLINSSKGGKKGGFTNPEVQSILGKRGGVKNKGYVWVTDENINIKYSVKMIMSKPVDIFLLENPTFRIGRKYEARGTYVWVNNGKIAKKVTCDIDLFFNNNPEFSLGQLPQKNPIIGSYTDGIKNYKYSSKEDKTFSFEDFLKQNTQFTRGRFKNTDRRIYVRINDGNINSVVYLDEIESIEKYLKENPQYKRGQLK